MDDIPFRNKSVLFSDGACMGSFWSQLKLGGKLNKNPYKKLLGNKILKDNYQAYLVEKEKNKGIIKLTAEEKVKVFLAKVSELDDIPSTNKTILFSDGACMGSFWSQLKSEGKLNKYPYKKLLGNKILKENYKEYWVEKEKNKGIIKLTSEEKVKIFLEKISELDDIPSQKKNVLFSDGVCMGSFWQTCKSGGRLNKDPYKKLLNNKILKENYNKYWVEKEKNKDIIKLTLEEKV